MSFRSKILAGEPVIGSWINTASPIVAEIMALAGFDFLTLDAEHSPIDFKQTHALAQAVRAGSSQCSCLVRVPDCQYGAIKRYMDAGANGVIVPLVNNAAQAQEAVDAVKYPPYGKRGVGFAASNHYGPNLLSCVENEHRESTVVVQIEHVDALPELDAIFSVQGVDAAMIGPYDLSASMGIPGQFDHPDMQAATASVVKACQDHGVVPGIHVIQPSPQEALERISNGYKFIAYSLDITMLSQLCREGINSIKKEL